MKKNNDKDQAPNLYAVPIVIASTAILVATISLCVNLLRLMVVAMSLGV